MRCWTWPGGVARSSWCQPSRWVRKRLDGQQGLLCLDHAGDIDRDGLGGGVQHGVLDREADGRGRAGTTVATALQTQVYDAVVVEAEVVDATGMGAQVRPDRVERVLDPGRDVVGVQVVQQEQTGDQIVLDQLLDLLMAQ